MLQCATARQGLGRYNYLVQTCNSHDPARAQPYTHDLYLASTIQRVCVSLAGRATI